jgi:deaminated glutathione amidase
MRFAAVQLSSQADVSSNLSAARREVEGAKRAGAEVVLLPEGFAFLGGETDKARVAEQLGPDPSGDGPIVKSLRAWSRELGVVIVAGGLPEASLHPERPYNTSAVFIGGELAAKYRKIHLFDVELSDGTRLFESAGNSAGDEIVTLDIGPLRVGLSICYDLRFPELFADLRRRGAQVILLSAAFTRTTGMAHWHTLLRARAIETQCYVVASAQFGEHPRDRKTFGHSLIIDPWGEIIAELAEGSGSILADLDPARVSSVRTQMPLEKHRRLC